MKKFVALLLSMLIVTTTGYANVSIPKELMSYPESFTAECKVSLSVDDNTDIRSLIDEMVATEGGMFSFLGVDFFNFLTAMFEYNSDLTVSANVSTDYTKVKLAVTNSDVFSSVVSSNLNYTVNSKSGLWLDMDITNVESPKLDLIFLSPTSDKYRYMSVGEYLPKENLPLIKTYLSPNVTQKIKEKYAQMISDNATVEKIGSQYKISMSNDDMIALMKAMMEYNPFYEEGLVEETDEEITPAFDGINIFGKDGMTTYYTLKNGQISRIESKVDISLNISEIAKAMGEEWQYENQGIINIKLSEIDNLTKIGTTVVKFPELNESNSISLNKVMEENMAQPEDDYTDIYDLYPFSFVSVYGETVFAENGNYYVPLRSILEDGYSDFISIDYQDGVVTATSEFFEGFNTITVNIRESKVYVDGMEQDCGSVMIVNDVTYVDSRLFTDIFGWELTEISHDVLGDTYNVSYWTVQEDIEETAEQAEL